jgi:large subunit ribosomal protein L2
MKFLSFNIKSKTLHRKLAVFSSKTYPLLKTSVTGFIKSNGRNNTGKITCHHKGGGHKRSYRVLTKFNDLNGIVTSIEYDPNRSSFVSSMFDLNQHRFFYTLAYSNCSIGDVVKSGSNAELYLGHTLTLAEIPEGTFVYDISDNFFSEGFYSKAAGTYSILLKKTKTHCTLKLPSGTHKEILLGSVASIGIVSIRHTSTFLNKKAGRSRWLNIRPTVRGVAMNPLDHPHGGGEGKKSGRKYTPWGKHIPRRKKPLSTSPLIIEL